MTCRSLPPPQPTDHRRSPGGSVTVRSHPASNHDEHVSLLEEKFAEQQPIRPITGSSSSIAARQEELLGLGKGRQQSARRADAERKQQPGQSSSQQGVEEAAEEKSRGGGASSSHAAAARDEAEEDAERGEPDAKAFVRQVHNLPSRAVQERHRCTHLPFRPWCRACVRARKPN